MLFPLLLLSLFSSSHAYPFPINECIESGAISENCRPGKFDDCLKADLCSHCSGFERVPNNDTAHPFHINIFDTLLEHIDCEKMLTEAHRSKKMAQFCTFPDSQSKCADECSPFYAKFKAIMEHRTYRELEYTADERTRFEVVKNNQNAWYSNRAEFVKKNYREPIQQEDPFGLIMIDCVESHLECDPRLHRKCHGNCTHCREIMGSCFHAFTGKPVEDFMQEIEFPNIKINDKPYLIDAYAIQRERYICEDFFKRVQGREAEFCLRPDQKEECFLDCAQGIRMMNRFFKQQPLKFRTADEAVKIKVFELNMMYWMSQNPDFGKSEGM